MSSKMSGFYEILDEHGYPTLDTLILTKDTNIEKHITMWLSSRGEDILNCSLVIKTMSRDSNDIWRVNGMDSAVNVVSNALVKNINTRISIEPFLSTERKAQISVVVIEGERGPVALVPTEISYVNKVGDLELADMEVETYY